ncbi:protein SPMIP1 isoform X1 [Myotis yumanensis]|uniref:protein SPMIP1 isoform X1 n=1 Tax=Myotis yumanensis TaxID=159337 RepID=UPI0038D3D776
MRDLFTFQNQACWEERLRKEAAARAAWKVNHGHKYPKERSLPRKRLQQALLHSAPGVGSLPATSSPDRRTGLPETQGVRAQPPGTVGVQEAQRATREPAGQTKRGSLEMRRVPSSTRQLLFQGLSHDGQGRALYLRERNRKKPAEKFRYPVLSSWEYGWHVGDAVKNTRLSIYAKCQPITETFHSKCGVFHFPRRTDQLM